MFGDTGYDSRFSVYYSQTLNSMQNSITMPLVLRAAIIAKRWFAKENEFATFVIEESVSNLQMVAVCLVSFGLTMCFFGSFIACLIGIFLMSVGAVVLRLSEPDKSPNIK